MSHLHSDIKSRIAAVESDCRRGKYSVGDSEWRWLDTGGEGRPIVLLPGSVGDAAMFFKIFERKKTLPRLIAVTYPSLADGEVISDQFYALLEHLRVEEPLIVGSSFSAYWLQHFSNRYPICASGFILGNGFSDSEDLAGVPLFDRKWIEESGADAVHAAWVHRLKNVEQSELVTLQLHMLSERQSPKNLYARFVGVSRAKEPARVNFSTNINLLECPDDPLISLEAQLRIRRRYPSAKTIVVSGGGHYPHVLRPDTYAEILREVWMETQDRS